MASGFVDHAGEFFGSPRTMIRGVVLPVTSSRASRLCDLLDRLSVLGRLSTSALARRVSASRRVVFADLQLLEDEGFVVSELDCSDGRRRLWSLDEEVGE